MNIKRSLYSSATALLLAGTLSAPILAEPQEIQNNSNLNSYLNQNSHENSAESKISALQIEELSAQGKINSSQLIIKFKDVSAPAAENTTLAKFSIKSIKDFYSPSKKLANSADLFGKIKIVSFSNINDLSGAFSALIKDPSIEYVAPNYKFPLLATSPNDLNNQLWGLNNTGQSRTIVDPGTGDSRTETGTADADIDAPEAWDIIHDANNTIVAVIDTGIDYNHSELATNMWTNPGEIPANGIDDDNNGYIDDIHGYDFADNDSDPMDVHGHGTHCSGTIAAQGNNGNNITGVAWNTQLMAVKIFADGENGAYTTDIINGILYAADMGAKVSNNSYGQLFANDIVANIVQKPMYDAISAANDAGMLFVAAAGNDGYNIDNEYSSTPAGLALPNIISIAASNHNDEPAYFTNSGVTQVDLAAPGVDIYSTFPNNEYATWNGTSMAAPHVTGAAALLIEQNGDLTPAEIKAILMNESDKPASLASTSASGGRLNVHKAISALQSGDGCESFTATNDQHIAADRATKTTVWFTTTYRAIGSGESLGSYGFTTTTLYENTPGSFSKIDDCQSVAVDMPPIVTVNGDIEQFVMVGSNYFIPSLAASATDREDGDISASIITSGSVDIQTPGRYIISYNVTDSAGNKAALETRAINVVEADKAPQVILFGDSCTMAWCSISKIIKNTPYQEPGYAGFDLIDGDITEDVFIIDNPIEDTSEEGVRFLYYDVIDSAGNHSHRANNFNLRIVAVLDAEMPHIWIRPPEGGFLSNGYEYSTWKRPYGDTSWNYSPSFSVIDLNTPQNEYEWWENNTSVTGTDSVDYTTTGSYTVTISTTDMDNNTSIATQTIHVINDITAPVITLYGDSEINLNIGDYFYEPGAMAVDDLDSYPQTLIKYYDEAGIEIENPLLGDTTEAATYTLEYLAEDGTGNQADPKYRTVRVIGNPPQIDSYEYSLQGGTLTATGTASDIDGDLLYISLEVRDLGRIICEGTTAFTCTLGIPEGETITVGLVAGDAEDNSSAPVGIETFTNPGEPSCYTATNQEHVNANRAVLQQNILVYAAGSNDYLGITSATSSIEETSAGVWVKVTNCN